MHLEYIDDNNFKLYIHDEKKIIEIDKIKDNPEQFFKNIFLKLKNKYHMRLNGLYKIDLYVCNNYGIVVELKHEDDEFYDDYIEGVDLKIKINDDCETLFEIEDVLLTKNMKNINIFLYKNKYYLMFVNKPSKKELFTILEHSKVIYGKITKKIINQVNILKV